MKKISARAFICLILCAVMLAGTAFYCVRFAVKGADWATADFNTDLYNQGQLARGRVLDRDGVVLSSVDENKNRIYNESEAVRKATLHAVGDKNGYIAAGAVNAFTDQLSGYNFVTGLNDNNEGNDLYLTINSDFNVAAYNAIGNKKGTVLVYNYKTGEILCMVSTPTFDPMNVPADITDGNKYEGVFINRALSGLYTPGSTMKTVTMAAAIENISDLDSKTYLCEKYYQIGVDKVTCAGRHGEIDAYNALVHSCNSAFAQISLSLGPDKIRKYFEKAGLTSKYNVNGIMTAAGSLGAMKSDMSIAWSGIGQDDDMVNPMAMAVYMGAVANGGKAAKPQIISKVTSAKGSPKSFYSASMTGTLIEKTTADKLSNMMKGAVEKEYGSGLFPDLDAYAKSGTAEVSGDNEDAWFVGFLKDKDYPYAFAVVVEEGGSGTRTAGRIASTVIKEMTGK